MVLSLSESSFDSGRERQSPPETYLDLLSQRLHSLSSHELEIIANSRTTIGNPQSLSEARQWSGISNRFVSLPLPARAYERIEMATCLIIFYGALSQCTSRVLNRVHKPRHCERLQSMQKHAGTCTGAVTGTFVDLRENLPNIWTSSEPSTSTERRWVPLFVVSLQWRISSEHLCIRFSFHNVAHYSAVVDLQRTFFSLSHLESKPSKLRLSW